MACGSTAPTSAGRASNKPCERNYYGDVVIGGNANTRSAASAEACPAGHVGRDERVALAARRPVQVGRAREVECVVSPVRPHPAADSLPRMNCRARKEA